MTPLGPFLKHLRQQHDRSRRWVERKSKELFPRDKVRHISHSYLRQIEEGLREGPNPLKLKTLAKIYRIDYAELLHRAGYLDDELATLAQSGQEMAAQSAETRLEKARQLIEHLENQGIRPEFFLNGILGLSAESLQLISRMVTTLSLQEKQVSAEGRSVAEGVGKKYE